MTLPSSGMAADWRRPLVIVRGIGAQELPLRVRDAGSVVTPTSGTCAVYRDTSATVLVASGAITPGTTSTYTLAAIASTETLSSDWIVLWTWAYGGVTYRERQRAYLVGSDIRPRVSDEDLYEEQPDLRHPARLPEGQSSWQPQISLAWDDVVGALTSAGRQPWLAVDAADLERVHRLYSLARVCGAILAPAGSHYAEAAVRYRRDAEAAMQTVRIEYEDAPTVRKAVGPCVIPCSPVGRPSW